MADAFIYPSSRETILATGFVGGFNAYAWLYVVSTALMGLSVSFMFKCARHSLPRMTPHGTERLVHVQVRTPLIATHDPSWD